MAVRSTMTSLIRRVRGLINDEAGSCQNFSDQEIQEALDASRMDVYNQCLKPRSTYIGSTIYYLDYYADLGDWEDDVTFVQGLLTEVEPSSSEPIVGHWSFATSIEPPMYISGKTYDVYCAGADLLDRLSVKWATAYNISMDGQSMHRSQVTLAYQALAKTLRMKQRAKVVKGMRTDINNSHRVRYRRY